MNCPQCGALMYKRTHSGKKLPYWTLNCSSCRFIIFYRGSTNEENISNKI